MGYRHLLTQAEQARPGSAERWSHRLSKPLSLTRWDSPRPRADKTTTISGTLG